MKASVLTRGIHALKEGLRFGVHRALPGRALRALVRRRLPRTINVEATSACNLACPLCPTHHVRRNGKFLDHQHIERILTGNGALRAVCFHVMGEPLVHPKVFEFVRQFSDRGILTHFGTNGMLLDGKLDALFESGLTSLSIAVDGVDAEDYLRYRKLGDFDRVVANTRELIQRKRDEGRRTPHVQIQMIMFSYNEDRDDDVGVFLDGFGADSVERKRPSYFVDYEALRTEEMNRKEAQGLVAAKSFLAGVDHENPERKYLRPASTATTRFYRDEPMCPQLEKGTVLADGRVVACCMDMDGTTAFGDLAEETFADVWRGERHQRVLEDFSAKRMSLCGSCTLAVHAKDS